MSNMSYCRFQNTYSDLSDCESYMGDDDLSAEEQRARKWILQLCVRIAREYGDEEDENDG